MVNYNLKYFIIKVYIVIIGIMLYLFANAAWAAARVVLPLPTHNQLTWENAELGIFFHYDLQVAHPHYTMTFRGDPFLSPTVPDTDSWLRMAKAMGARYAVYVCKHASGYMFFQCHAYPFGLSYSKWDDGKADMVRSFVNSCHKYGVQPGLYCTLSTNYYLHISHCLVDNGRGDNTTAQASYAHICEKIETRLWSHYGRLFYCWFDGGELPVNKGGPNLVPLLKKYQPDMVCFQGPSGAPGGLTRWIGNEAGEAPYPCWETVARDNQSGAGNPHGKIWEPAEVDVSILAGDHWFWHPGRQNPLLTLPHLIDIYYHSIGRGCNLIINAPINQYGRIARTIRRRLAAFGQEIRHRFAYPLDQTSGRGSNLVMKFPQATTINNVMIMERISKGQRVRKYLVQGRIHGRWIVLCRGSSIGHKRLQQFKPILVSAVRLVVLKSVAPPLISKFAVYNVHTFPELNQNKDNR
jgi:alpha-L-fucosidase